MAVHHDELDADLGAGVRLRRADADDLPAIVGLLAADEVSAARDELSPEVGPDHIRGFEAIDRDPAHDLVVGVTPDGRIVATLQLSVIPDLARGGVLRGQIEAVRVATDLQGRGVGGAMLRWAAARAVERGCNLLQLTSDRQRDQAHAFYEQLGMAATHLGFKLRLD